MLKGLIAAGAICAAGSAYAADIIIVRDNDARHYDPHKYVSVTQSEVMALMGDTLVAIEDDLKTIHPYVATSWTISPDGKVYTFKIRQDISFCSGKAMTAEDVAATFNRWKDPKTQSTNIRSIIGPSLDTITALDKETVEFRLREPFSAFLQQLAQPYGAILNVEVATKLGDQFGTTGLDTTGPYCWNSWKPRQEMIVTRHEGYKWGPAFYSNKGAPAADRVIFKVLPEGNSRVAAMLAGEADISYTMPPSAIAQFRKDPRFAIVSPRAFGWVAMLGMKTHNKPLDELAVRKAVTYAIDSKLLVDALYYGEADVARSIVSPSSPGYSKKSEAYFPTYDPKLAEKTLEDAGWKKQGQFRYKNGVKLAPKLYTYKQDILEAVGGMLKEVGIDAQIEFMESAMLQTHNQVNQTAELWISWGAHMHALEQMWKYAISTENATPNFVSKKDGVGKDLDAAILAAQRSITEEEKQDHLDKAQRLVAEGYYIAPLVHERMMVVYNKSKVSGVLPHGIGGNGLYKALDLKPLK